MYKIVAGMIVLAICILGWSNGGVGQEVPAPRGELRVVDTDPNNFAWIAWSW